MSAFKPSNTHLAELSQIVIDGEITYKIDNIATVYINNRYYFNIYRRYNSSYNIVIEDYNNELHVQQDNTIRASLKKVLCLTEDDTHNMYTYTATSYKHNSSIPSTNKDVLDMRWTDIHAQFQAINVDFRGIFTNTSKMDVECISDNSVKSVKSVPSTPRNQIISPDIECPPAPKRLKISHEDMDAANTLLTLSIPRISMCAMSESEIPVCHSSMVHNEDTGEDTSEDTGEDASEDTYKEYDTKDIVDNYTILRSGLIIPKIY